MQSQNMSIEYNSDLNNNYIFGFLQLYFKALRHLVSKFLLPTHIYFMTKYLYNRCCKWFIKT